MHAAAVVRLCFFVTLALLSLTARADIYTFLDENGISHISDFQVDSRYTLFMKTAPAARAAEAEIAAAVPPLPYGASAPLNKPYDEMIATVAREQGIEPALLHAVITVESGYNARAKSRKGASGLMQLIPATAKRFGVTDVWNPLENIRGGARYLRELLATFKDDMRLALAAYNAGEGAVMRSGNRIPPYAETRAYVPRVLELYERYRAKLAI
jgi:soluble lytic murein transglycosylase-like protein